jgi:hypothetical protein
MRLEMGDVHVACMMLNGAFQIVADSGDVVATPGPMPGPAAVQLSPGLRHSPLSSTTAEPLQLTV